MIFRIPPRCAQLILAGIGCLTPLAVQAAEPQAIDFTRQIQPILADRCYQCHGPDSQQRKAELRLDVEDSALAKAIVPGKPEESEMLKRILSTDPEEQMPPAEARRKPFTVEEVELLRTWIAAGAPWAQHWAFETPAAPALPAVSHPEWPRDGLDHFVLARIEAEALSPAKPASRETLIRRLSLDLTGLPPTPEEIDTFLADTAPDAYARLVDRILASPHYGENMARIWLDGARYADTNGFQNDFNRQMWPWRDWVIQAFNNNMPFDRFTVEQIAGDLLPDATDAQRIGSGFNRNNRSNTEGGSIEDEWRVENIIDRVESTSAVFLGLTMGCARCHDHKYDPISQKEFYRFFAIFNSTEDKGFYEETRGNAGPIVTIATPETTARLAEFDEALKDARRSLRKQRAELDKQLMVWEDPAPAPPAPDSDLRLPLRGHLRASATAGYAAQIQSPVRYAAATGPVFQEGLTGPALHLDGTAESHADLGPAIDFEKDRPFTISFWVRPETSGAIFSRMDDARQFRGVDALLGDDGSLVVRLVHAWPENALKVIAEKGLRMGTWSHVCIAYDGSAKAQGVQIFIGGAAAPLKTETDALAGSIHAEAPVLLGRLSESAFFKGAVADFQYFSRVLDAPQIRSIRDTALDATYGAGVPEDKKESLEAFLEAERTNQLTSEIAAVKKIEDERNEYAAKEVPTVMVMKELPEPRPTYRLLRGLYDAPDTTETLSPGVPAFLPPLPEGAPANRLGLAQWLVDPANPLVARVAVNRFWLQFFGKGLVKAPDNFGTQSDPPSHPELLDYLATEFIAMGWDMKAFQKRIVMSATYQQDSAVSTVLAERDPENDLYARGPRFRMAAESIRDNALAVSGLLARRIGGPSVKPYQPDKLWEELAGGAGEGPYVQSKGEDLYRRSLYTYRKRTVPHPTLSTFDAPSWEICRVLRARTNTPLQALALLNDVTYVEASRKLAERMLSEAPGDAMERVRYGFRLVTGRYPNETEWQILSTGLQDHLRTYANDPEAAAMFAAQGEAPADTKLDPVELPAYMAIAGVILNLDEAITIE
ncbi:MAG: DUF1553 domain-containing protein [Candidatus Hydrogenedentes bacterium]|nr:DUF1553 domain-containing protein [Candidatus Hydrogenedentota bacterium]